MAKFAHKLRLPLVVLAPVLALLRQRGLRVEGSEGLGFTLSDTNVLPTGVGVIQTRGYTFNLKTDSYSLLQSIDQEMKTYQYRNLMNGNWEPELADLMRTDKSFMEAVKRLQALWKAKSQPLEATPDELKVSPRYNIDGSVGQSAIDPSKVNPRRIKSFPSEGWEN